MPIKAAVARIEGELLINLRGCSTFKETKEELERKLLSINHFKIGSQVSIDVGDKKLSGKQTREMEDILLDHGLYLKEILSDNLSEEQLAPDANLTQLWEDVSFYHDTFLLCRHLRSGQRFFNGGNIVMLGDINPGAEVIAGGNILVMGSLRGIAHAGAFGDENTIIAAYRLNPTQLRIANHITRPPDGELVVVNEPEVARIKAGRVVIEKLKI